MNDRYRGYQILVIEDDDGSYSGTKAEIEEVTGRTPHRARGITDALKILDQFTTDSREPIRDPRQSLAMVVIDQNLSLSPEQNRTYPDIPPGEAGLFLIRHVHERCPLASVGILTAYASTIEEAKFRAGKLNADFYWDKSDHPAKLREDIRAEIDRYLDAVNGHNVGAAE